MRCYFQTSRSCLYLALELTNLHFSAKEITDVLKFWTGGLSIFKISELVKRDVDGVALLLLDLAENTKLIPPRKFGLLESPPIDLSASYYNKLSRFENKHLEEYMVFQKYQMVWDERDVVRFDGLWKRKTSLTEMAKVLKRPIIEVVILLFDRAIKEKIRPLPGRRALLDVIAQSSRTFKTIA